MQFDAPSLFLVICSICPDLAAWHDSRTQAETKLPEIDLMLTWFFNPSLQVAHAGHGPPQSTPVSPCTATAEQYLTCAHTTRYMQQNAVITCTKVDVTACCRCCQHAQSIDTGCCIVRHSERHYQAALPIQYKMSTVNLVSLALVANAAPECHISAPRS